MATFRSAAFVFAWAALAALPLHAQTIDPAPAASVAHPWSSLNSAQQDILAPLRAHWDRLSPHKQAHLLARSRHWTTLPPARREAIRRHIARWQKMTPAERKQARANRRRYHQLPAAQRQQLHEAFERFQQLPPVQREKLIRQWHSQTIEQRLRGLDHPPESVRSPSSVPPSRLPGDGSGG